MSDPNPFASPFQPAPFMSRFATVDVTAVAEAALNAVISTNVQLREQIAENDGLREQMLAAIKANIRPLLSFSSVIDGGRKPPPIFQAQLRDGHSER